MSGQQSVPDFADLGPNQVLDAVESAGYRCDGVLLALNSYENRVYRVGIDDPIDDQSALVAKFYRPKRWSDAAIIEEHAFCAELAGRDLPVVAPLREGDGTSLFRHGEHRFALYPNRPGRAPDLEDADSLGQLGRLIGRLHNVGALRPFQHRTGLSVDSLGQQSRDWLLEQGFIPPDVVSAYDSASTLLLDQVQAAFERAGQPASLRLHGDCHPGNVLWVGDGAWFVDLDDARMGPALQDLWMFITGDRNEMTARLADLLDGYTRFRDFDPRELQLFEALRSLRMMHYAAWLARRWQDPAFPLAFPWFNSERYWGEHVLALREQSALMDEPPLAWD